MLSYHCAFQRSILHTYFLCLLKHQGLSVFMRVLTSQGNHQSQGKEIRVFREKCGSQFLWCRETSQLILSYQEVWLWVKGKMGLDLGKAQIISFGWFCGNLSLLPCILFSGSVDLLFFHSSFNATNVAAFIKGKIFDLIDLAPLEQLCLKWN